MPWGLIGTIVLVIGVESVVARNWLDLLDPVGLSWRFSERAARRSGVGCDVLCLGDSLVKHGLIPSVIERESGLKSINAAAARGPALMTYFLLRRACEAGGRPPAILIDSKPAVLIGGVDYNARYWPVVLGIGECLELSRLGGRPEFSAAMLTARLLPTLRSRLEIRSNVVAALSGEPAPLAEINRLLWRNWSVNGGANVASLESRYRGELSPEIQERLHPDLFFVDRSNDIGIDRLLSLAAEGGTRVFWLLPPISAELQEWRERTGAEARFEQYVRSCQGRFPEVVTVLDGRWIVSDPSLFVDATHLAGRGAVVLSRAVASALKAELGNATESEAGKWINLNVPPDDPRANDDANLEDVDRSKEIIRQLRAQYDKR